jgi:hypothetical protein
VVTVVMDVALFMPPNALALILLDAALPPAETPGRNVGEPLTPVARDVICEAAPAGDEPRPKVPRPAAPKPLVPRPATLMFGTPAVEFAAIIELPELDEGDAGETALLLVDVAVGELGELVTPELLTELHGVDVLVPAP